MEPSIKLKVADPHPECESTPVEHWSAVLENGLLVRSDGRSFTPAETRDWYIRLNGRLTPEIESVLKRSGFAVYWNDR